MKGIFRTGCLWILILLMLAGCAAEAPEQQQPTTPPQIQGELNCLEISRFSGAFVEDGSDEKVKDVAAILVSNDTGKFLDLATVTYTVGERTATFKITGLPAGGQVWVLEKDRMVISKGDELVYQDCQTTFNPNAMVTTEALEVSRQGNVLTVRNVTDVELKNVCVYYKNRMEDGTFLGGITYLMNFGDLSAGASVQRSSGHLGDSAQIVKYGYQVA